MAAIVASINQSKPIETSLVETAKALRVQVINCASIVNWPLTVLHDAYLNSSKFFLHQVLATDLQCVE